MERRVWLGLATGVLLLASAAVVVWQQHAAQAEPEVYCAQVWSAFDRTSKLARELGAVLEAAASEPADRVLPRMQAVQQGLADELALIERLAPSPGAEDVPPHARAALTALLAAADPQLLDHPPEVRVQMGPYLREQLLIARAEARAAAAALRAADEECANRHAPGVLRPLGRPREGPPPS
ncbi:MAG: hypothetical protein IRZ14_00670 [Chloroflexi bacterium]|nr:hypothetical protein [Chloroflexota bacterium]